MSCVLDTGGDLIGLQHSCQEDAVRRTQLLALKVEGGFLCANAKLVACEERKLAVFVLKQSHPKSAMTFISKLIVFDTAEK